MSSLLITPRKRTELESLKDICLNTLIDNRDMLGDVGHADGALLRQVLVHCTADKLAKIEDTTWECSSRDLSWETWEIWMKLYEDKFGRIPPSTTVPELSIPEDANGYHDYNEALAKGAGNYRLLYQEKIEAVEAKRKQIAMRAKGIMEKQKQEKESRKVQMLSGPVPNRKKSSWKTKQADTKRGALVKKLGLSGGKDASGKPRMTGSNQMVMNCPIAQTKAVSAGTKRSAAGSWRTSNGKRSCL